MSSRSSTSAYTIESTRTSVADPRRQRRAKARRDQTRRDHLRALPPLAARATRARSRCAPRVRSRPAATRCRRSRRSGTRCTPSSSSSTPRRRPAGWTSPENTSWIAYDDANEIAGYVSITAPPNKPRLSKQVDPSDYAACVDSLGPRRVDLRDPLAHAALGVARLAALVPPHARRRPEHPSERRHARDRHRQDVGAQPVPAARDARPLRRQGGRCQLLADDAAAHRVQHGLCHRVRAPPPPHARANLPGDRPPRRGRRERAAAAAPPLVAAAAGRPVGAVLPRRIELGRVGL